VENSLSAREECIRMLKFHLGRAQKRMKVQADKHRTEKELHIEDLEHIKLQPYRQSSVELRT